MYSTTTLRTIHIPNTSVVSYSKRKAEGGRGSHGGRRHDEMIQTFTQENDRQKYFLASRDTVSSPLPLPVILLPQIRGGDFLDFSRRGGGASLEEKFLISGSRRDLRGLAIKAEMGGYMM